MNKVIYAVKLSVPKDIEDEWISYMKAHIGDILGTKCFDDFNIKKIMPSQSDPAHSDLNCSSYLIEYEAANLKALEEYMENYAEALRADYKKHFGDKTPATREIYEDQFLEWYEPISWTKKGSNKTDKPKIEIG